MYSVGDRVVYPMHGAGIIEAIEEREVLGEKQQYYIMRIASGDMKVMIPLKSADDVGLRPIISEEMVVEVLAALQGETSKMSPNWNKRYRANMEKIRSGDVFEVAEVVRNLTMREREKGLSTGERKMLESSRQILLSELLLAREGAAGEAEQILNSFVAPRGEAPSPLP